MKAAFLLLVGLFLRACSSSEAEVTDEHIHSVLKATSRTNQQEWLMLHSQHVAEVEDGKGKVREGVWGGWGKHRDRAWAVCRCLHTYRAIGHRAAVHTRWHSVVPATPVDPTAQAKTSIGTPCQVWDLVVYGDSITEAFRGTTVGFRSERWSENEAAWAALVTAPPPPARRYNAAVYSVSGETPSLILQGVCCGCSHRDIRAAQLPGLSAGQAWHCKAKSSHACAIATSPPAGCATPLAGDQAMHLLWRLQNGEGPRDLNPAVVMVQIGTNDIGHLTYLYQVRLCCYVLCQSVAEAPTSQPATRQPCTCMPPFSGTISSTLLPWPTHCCSLLSNHFPLLQDDTDRVVRTVHLAQRLVLEELAAQAPGAQRVVVSLPPLQVPGAEEEPSNK